MNNKFDELAKELAQSVTRRQALKRFGLGLAGMALACFGLGDEAKAGPKPKACACSSDAECGNGFHCSYGYCVPSWCDITVAPCCCDNCKTGLPSCEQNYAYCAAICQSRDLSGRGCISNKP